MSQESSVNDKVAEELRALLMDPSFLSKDIRTQANTVMMSGVTDVGHGDEHGNQVNDAFDGVSVSKYDVDTDFTSLSFGMEFSIRNKLGKYLSALKIEEEKLENRNDKTSVTGSKSGQDGASVTYTLGVDGQGVGEPRDNFIFVNTENKEDLNAVRYGMTVSIRSHYARDRFLGIKEGNKVGFWRNLIGQGEKWIVLKKHSLTEQIKYPSEFGMSNKDYENFIHSSDTIILQSVIGNSVLCLHEGTDGAEAKLVSKDRTVLGNDTWQIVQFGSQPLPAWYIRPFLSDKFLNIPSTIRYPSSDIQTRTFLSVPSEKASSYQPLNMHPIIMQHNIAMKELLLALTGISGEYIHIPTNTKGARSMAFVIDHDSTDKSLANEVNALLPLCNSVLVVREFIKIHSTYEYGLVSHALVSAIKVIVRKFDTLVTQLEHLLDKGQLTMQKLTFMLQPSKSVLKVIENLTKRLKNCTGGRILDVLHNCILERGDKKTKDLHMHLLAKASEPFIKMLSLWLLRGDLSDPYKEFMINEDMSVTRQTLAEDFNSQYWEKRYTLRENQVPMILKYYAQKALKAGKYLNVVREASYDVIPEDVIALSNIIKYDPLGDNTFPRLIDSSFMFSSRALLRMLEDNHKLSTHLRSLRRFFLLEHGDFFIQFMDTAEEELRRDAKDISLSRIQNLLQLAVQTSTLATDPHREDLTCTLAPHNLIQHLALIQSAGESSSYQENAQYRSLLAQGLKGVEALTLDYMVQWPISIVLSRRAITKYQLLSRLLYFSKHVESRLLSSWKDHQNTKDLNVRQALGSSFCLRHRMLHFLQNFVYYMTLEVIGPRAHEMQTGMANAQDMDEVLALHEKFLDSCLEECLLASQGLLQILTKIMTTCLLFSDQMRRFSLSTTSYKDSQTLFINTETSHESFLRMLEKFNDAFDKQLGQFLERLLVDSYNHHAQLSNLCVRLDYNGFYTSKFTDTNSGRVSI